MRQGLAHDIEKDRLAALAAPAQGQHRLVGVHRALEDVAVRDVGRITDEQERRLHVEHRCEQITAAQFHVPRDAEPSKVQRRQVECVLADVGGDELQVLERAGQAGGDAAAAGTHFNDEFRTKGGELTVYAGHADIDLEGGITNLFFEHAFGQGHQTLGAGSRDEHARIHQERLPQELLRADDVRRRLAGRQAGSDMGPKVGHRLGQRPIRTSQEPGAILTQQRGQDSLAVIAGRAGDVECLVDRHGGMIRPVRPIAIDCRFADRPAGLGRFTRELVAALLDRAPADTDWTLIVRPGEKPWWTADRKTRLIETALPHYSLREQLELPRLVPAETGAFLAPHFNAPIFLRVPTVVTIHDFILHRYPNDASPLRQLAYRLLMRTVAQRSATICAVSPFVAQEVRAMYGERMARKTVTTGEGVSDVYNARPETEQAHVRARYGLTRPFLLYVGNAKQHKNVEGLLQAFQLANLPGTDLVVVASGKEADAFPWPKGVIRLHDVPEADLPALYSAAAACVTMTRYEGFGLPLVEAIACGCPVVAPALTAIPDAVGGAEGVLLLPNLDPATFAAAFRALPKRPAPRKLCSWDGPADIVWSALERVSRRS